MRQFILDATPKVEEILTLNGTTYKLKTVNRDKYCFEVWDTDEPDLIYLNKTELKALYLLLTTKDNEPRG
jgi:hypothetical protein